ncbi:MAG: HDOD domain-containing protein [Phycisphaerales bacterium]
MGTGGMNPTLVEALASLDRLPALPSTLARAISALNSPKSGAPEFEAVFRTDEALAAAIVRRANSAALGGNSNRSYALRESIARLGRNALMRITLEQQGSSMLRRAGRCYGLERGELWRGSLGGAAIAERLARESRAADADLAYTAALLRDLGKIALEAMANDERAFQWSTWPPRPFVEFEAARFGADHARLGAALAERWNLPAPIVLAIATHHAPPIGPQDPLCDLVHCADCIARWAGMGVGDDGLCYALAPTASAALGITRERVEQLAAHAWNVVTDAESALQTTSGRKSA